MDTFMRIILINILLLFSTPLYAVPPVTGKPFIDKPGTLEWDRDFLPAEADLTTPMANLVNDLHSHVENCDIVLSTAGNYHMALKQLWYDYYLPHNPRLKNWFYTTSPPISIAQAQYNELTIGNWKSRCRPGVAVGPKKLMDDLEAAGLTTGERIPIIQNQGNVLLVKRGNPKNILTIWDLARADVKLVTSNPYSEPGSFGNYSESIYDIANADSSYPAGYADRLFNSLFGLDSVKWLAGERIHHREVPWSIAYGHADVGMMFYHLARYAKVKFPEQFDIVPLGGTVRVPQPVTGNKIGKLFAIRINGKWTVDQEYYREALLKEFVSDIFTKILISHGLLRPDEFIMGDIKPVP